MVIEEKEQIKNYLKNIKFSTNDCYINLIGGYVKFKNASIKEVPKEIKGCKK